MSKVLEVYRILKDKLGEEEARVVAEAFEEVKGVRENLSASKLSTLVEAEIQLVLMRC